MIFLKFVIFIYIRYKQYDYHGAFELQQNITIAYWPMTDLSSWNLLGYSSCVNKRTAHVGWQPETDYMNHEPEEMRGHYEITYTWLPTVSHSQLVEQTWGSESDRRVSREGVVQAALAASVGNLPLKKQGRKGQNIESQHN